MSRIENGSEARLGFASLVLFRGILEDPVVEAILRLLDAPEEPTRKRVAAYAAFVSRLYRHGGNWSQYLLELLLRDENPYMLLTGAGSPIPAYWEDALARELSLLQNLSGLAPEQMARGIDCPYPLPGWATEPLDFAAAYRDRLAHLHEIGYGMFSAYHAFTLQEGVLTAVKHPDPVRMEDLTGYEAERAAVMENTLALLAGKSAANILLYGDSGTGKSTCVKVVANALKERGLRLIELRKEQLGEISSLLDRLHDNPLKFILFIDDLSFSREQSGLSSIKAILEGSTAAKPPNTVIYATSNRRHFVRESFADRQGDDIHLRDTIEETGSLSDRFGLLVTFLRPDKALYLSIVDRYCRELGMPYDEEMTLEAEAFALRRGGRSARTARQFVESVASRKA
jgi:predicted AAA+ superfamily ATPase